jgi:hypothetical protein
MRKDYKKNVFTANIRERDVKVVLLPGTKCICKSSILGRSSSRPLGRCGRGCGRPRFRSWPLFSLFHDGCPARFPSVFLSCRRRGCCCCCAALAIATQQLVPTRLGCGSFFHFERTLGRACPSAVAKLLDFLDFLQLVEYLHKLLALRSTSCRQEIFEHTPAGLARELKILFRQQQPVIGHVVQREARVGAASENKQSEQPDASGHEKKSKSVVITKLEGCRKILLAIQTKFEIHLQKANGLSGLIAAIQRWSIHTMRLKRREVTAAC